MLTLLRNQLSWEKNLRRIPAPEGWHRKEKLTEKSVDKLHTSKCFLHHRLETTLWGGSRFRHLHVKTHLVASVIFSLRTWGGQSGPGWCCQRNLYCFPLLAIATLTNSDCILLPAITATIAGYYCHAIVWRQLLPFYTTFANHRNVDNYHLPQHHHFRVPFAETLDIGYIVIDIRSIIRLSYLSSYFR